MSDVWFSAMLGLVVLVEGQGANQRMRSVVVFRAPDWPEARNRALEIGRAMESTYANGEGEEVRWRLETVETLDMLGDDITDGREVYSEPVHPQTGESIAFDAHFHPEASEPQRTGV